MSNRTVPAAVEGMPSISRREALRSIGVATVSALAVVAAPPIASAVTRMVGFNDRPYQSQPFSGPGYYAFADGGLFGRVVMYAHIDDHWGISLSDGPGEEVRAYVSHRSFDVTCRGKCMTADEVDRRTGKGRYADLVR